GRAERMERDARERAYDPAIILSAKQKKCRAKKDGPPVKRRVGGADAAWMGRGAKFNSPRSGGVSAQFRRNSPTHLARSAAAHGSVAKRSRPVGLSVLTSKVRISIAPPTSIVTAMRSSATAVAITRAPFGSSAVTSADALPSALETR